MEALVEVVDDARGPKTGTTATTSCPTRARIATRRAYVEDVYTALDTADRPTLYVASAAGASVARVIIVAISAGLGGAAG